MEYNNINLEETSDNTYASYEVNKITLVRMYSIISRICAYAHYA